MILLNRGIGLQQTLLDQREKGIEGIVLGGALADHRRGHREIESAGEDCQPAEYPLLPALGIGLTDLAKHHAGNDDELPRDAFDVAALQARIARHAPRVLAFTSKAAARAALGRAAGYGLQPERIGETRLFVLPSPSGQARGHWQLEPWQALADLVRG